MPIYIKTIAQYQALTEEQRQAIVKSIDTASRLRGWLGRGGTGASKVPEACVHCEGSGKTIHHKRNNADIHPSSADKCLKVLWYACTGRADEKIEHIDASTRVIFDFGTAWHQWVQTNYGLRGAWGDPHDYYPEVPLDPDMRDSEGNPYYPLSAQYRQRGHMDAAVDNYYLPPVPGFNDQVIIRLMHEYKTIKEQNYEKLTKAKKEHELQATIYAVVTDIPFISFVYFNKNGGAFTDFNVGVDMNVWEKIRLKSARVLELAEQGQMPPWEETSAMLAPSECRGCGYAHMCRPNERHS